MKIVIVNCGNGKDNTLEVVNAFKEHADHHNTTEIIDIGELNISSGGSADEETNTAVSKLIKSDVVVFVSPVSLSKMPFVIPFKFCNFIYRIFPFSQKIVQFFFT